MNLDYVTARFRAAWIKDVSNVAEMTFEAALARLEEIVALLEGGSCSLDESLKLFEEGTKLTAFCSDSLKAAEQKIVQLTQGEGE